MARRVDRGKRVEHVSTQAFCLPPLRLGPRALHALEFLPGKMWYPLPPVGGLRFPSPELYSHMWSLSERASHLSFISCLLDTTCCNFSRICGAERGKSPGFSNAPYCPRQPQTASKSKLGHTVLDSSLCSAVCGFGVRTSSF